MQGLIRRGSSGEHVVDVQRRLIALGFDIPSEERSGSFGTGTERAVQSFQQVRGLLVDGIVGDDTWRELVEASWHLGDRALYLAAPHLRGDDVRALQDRLNTMGFDTGRVDGIFGPQTARGVREFQRNYGIGEDGIVGQATVRALSGLPPHIGAETPAAHVREWLGMRPRPSGLTGLRVLLDPGHGGEDHGTVGGDGLREDRLAYTLCRLVESHLAAAGAHVFLSRRDGVGATDRTRASLANVLEADVFLSLHFGGGKPSARGAAAFYFGHDRFHSASGKRLAELLLEEVCPLGLADGRAHPLTIPVLRETRMTAVVLEPGHLTNADEEKLLGDTDFQHRLAGAIVAGLVRFVREPIPA